MESSFFIDDLNTAALKAYIFNRSHDADGSEALESGRGRESTIQGRPIEGLSEQQLSQERVQPWQFNHGCDGGLCTCRQPILKKKKQSIR